MTKLVPKNVAPIEGLTARAHRRHDSTKTDALDTDVGQAARSNTEGFPHVVGGRKLVSVHLDRGRSSRRKHVMELHHAPSLVEKARHVALQDGALVLGVANIEDPVRGGVVLLGDPRFVKKLQRVVDADIEVVSVPGVLERRHTPRFVSVSSLRQPELGPSFCVVGVEGDRLLHHRDDVGVSMFPLCEFADDAIELTELLVAGENLGLRGLEGGGVAR
jgi:hypothetical protein